MGIEIIGTLVQKNKGTFPIIDSNNIKGGYYHVATIDERDNLPQERIKLGMLCYVEEDDKIYRLKSSGWVQFMENVSRSNATFYIGDTPPDDKSLVWIDTSINSIDKKLDSLIIDEIKSILATYKQQVEALVSSLTEEIIDLKDRVLYLELNPGTGGGGGVKPPTTSKSCITMEDGSYILLEDGSKLLLEESSQGDTTVTTCIVLEDGSKLLLEDGSKLLREEA